MLKVFTAKMYEKLQEEHTGEPAEATLVLFVLTNLHFDVYIIYVHIIL